MSSPFHFNTCDAYLPVVTVILFNTYHINKNKTPLSKENDTLILIYIIM